MCFISTYQNSWNSNWEFFGDKAVWVNMAKMQMAMEGKYTLDVDLFYMFLGDLKKPL